MKRSELFFGAILVPLDFMALMVAAATAYYLRVSPTVQEIRPALFLLELPLVTYLQLSAIVSVGVMLIFSAQGLYALQSTRRAFEELARIVSGITIGGMLIILYIFLSAELFQSRFILVAAYVLAIIFVTVFRFFIRRLQRNFLRQGLGSHRVVLVGNGRYSRQLGDLFKRRPDLGYYVVGSLDEVRLSILENVQAEEGVDLIIQTDPTMPAEDNLVLLDFAEQYKLDYAYVPDLFEAHAAHVQYRHIGGVPVMQLQRTPLDGWGRIAKRTIDIIGALVGLIITSPILLVTAIAIKLDSSGPVLYHQTRIGRNKESFEIYKFRSMYLEYSTGQDYGGAEAQAYERKLREKTNERKGPLFKMRSDPRITRVGRFIRRARIDELPQFFNVLRGEMSLLGPRPHLPEEVVHYDKYESKLFTIKPGMSGMAQVNGNAGLSFNQEASLDVSYIEGWSLKLDFILLVKTFILLGTDRNAV